VPVECLRVKAVEQQRRPDYGRQFTEEHGLGVDACDPPAEGRQAHEEPGLDPALCSAGFPVTDSMGSFPGIPDEYGGPFQYFLARSVHEDRTALARTPFSHGGPGSGLDKPTCEKIPEGDLPALRTIGVTRETRHMLRHQRSYPARCREGIGLDMIDEEDELPEIVPPPDIPVCPVPSPVDPPERFPEFFAVVWMGRCMTVVPGTHGVSPAIEDVPGSTYRCR